MENSPFKKLAKELRFMIWEKVVTVPNTIVIVSDQICACVVSKGKDHCDQMGPCINKTKILANLPRTCREIREECLPIFLKKNQFLFTAITPKRQTKRTYCACASLQTAGRKFTSFPNSPPAIHHTNERRHADSQPLLAVAGSLYLPKINKMKMSSSTSGFTTLRPRTRANSPTHSGCSRTSRR